MTASPSSTASAVPADTGVRAPRSGLRARWRVIDIVVASVLGVASGLVFVIWNTASVPVGGFFQPLLPASRRWPAAAGCSRASSPAS
ncbi:ABC-type cobalt transport system, permease component [Clavibacter michiganensis subsp. michiganensis]|uniref:hypothetical protein n=1 Tax=Clavibacter michiganensis TaxID=28447 RepID=UPI000B632EA0|nr:hypothetical protein [Clavibacter michiganensis]OUD99723.1 ABC-type cobalt transport system, permease component [Clavibacter michiganensis subsp. michiganensis]